MGINKDMTNFPEIPKSPCCFKPYLMTTSKNMNKKRNGIFFFVMTIFAGLWVLAYLYVLPISNWLVFEIMGFQPDSQVGLALEFFIYDSIKILLLLVGMIYVIAWLRASLSAERIRIFLLEKGQGTGYCLGALFGAITPFCSCSSIPLFLGFVSSGIPVGITMSFLITSPLINEIAVVLLWNLLGWKLTIIYVVVGMLAGIIGGIIMDKLKAERWLEPFILDVIKNNQTHHNLNSVKGYQKLTVFQRHAFAYDEMISTVKRIGKWVVIGVAIGAVLHGFVPDNWFAKYLGEGQWWTVPSAVLVGIPLYTNVTGVIPIMESLLVKGLPLGTTLAFCMSAVVASIPEVILLRQIMTIRLQAVFIGYLWVIFTLVGWFFNSIQFQIF